VFFYTNNFFSFIHYFTSSVVYHLLFFRSIFSLPFISFLPFCCPLSIYSCALVRFYFGRVISQAGTRRLPTLGGPGSSSGQVMWDLWWTKWHWGRCSPNTSISPANSHTTDCSTIIIYHQDWYNRIVSGRRNKWTQPHHTPRN
jgi:hypothetical protein